MFNKLLDVCEEKNGGKVGFTKAESLPQGTGVKDLEVITHSLFYLRRHGKTLKNAGCVLGSSIDVDSFFDSGNARRTFPHKLDRQKLMEICTNLRNVYDGTWLRRNVWKWLKTEVANVISCLERYEEYLQASARRMSAHHQSTSTLRSVGDFKVTSHEKIGDSENVPENLKDLDKLLQELPFFKLWN